MTVATYRRPGLLRELLQTVVPQTEPGRHVVVVVDNDPLGSARVVAGEFPSVRYLLEENPGIAAARNRAVGMVIDDVTAVAFVDDDETVGAGWLESMISALDGLDADVIVGPVIPILPESASPLIVRLRFFQRPRARTGDDVRWPATNNSIVTVEALRRLEGDHFRESFSRTGGSDAELFWRLRRLGIRMRWLDEAVVYERVPPERATWRWLWRRGVRLGNVSGRLLSRERPRSYVAGVAAARLLVGLVLGPVFAVVAPRRAALTLMHVPKAVGMVRSMTGNYVQEYAR
ncbi:glycosyltransferase family 2 protein [Nakamurella flavida]|uniref:Glycosyltransferase family 2 protein n=1 Tax=Nakamurella flavida TaxID=363630 RepID=A0A938YN55_9ACTN|nr:glycosyltransferase [Nakamurella flavida]MBM9477783.1 glycosyltransferase family 2 protein [Nakamurella flavida]MDP9779336.1 GT2 family glycosyltransferase [Nakamurella flavida]